MIPKKQEQQIEIYRAQEGSLCKIKRLSENPIFLRYEQLMREEINNLIDLPHSNNIRKQNAVSEADEAKRPAATGRNDDITINSRGRCS